MDLIPQQQVRSEENGETHLVCLFKPRFSLAFIQKKLKNPYYRINLDQLGTIVWKNIDGRKSVYEIAQNLQEQSNEPLEQLYQRIAVFIKSLARNGLIQLTAATTED